MLHSLPSVRQYLFSLYECRYSVFFQSLGEVIFVVVVCVCSQEKLLNAKGLYLQPLSMLVLVLCHILKRKY